MIGTNFTFGDSSFENATSYFSQSNGDPENQAHVALLANLSESISSVVYDQEPKYLGTFGSFFIANYWRELRSDIYNAIPWSLALKVQNFFHTYTNNYFGTNSWFDISIEVYSTHGYTLGSQWVTWRNEGFSTVFEFLSVSFIIAFFVYLSVLSFVQKLQRKRPDPAQYLDVESKVLTNKTVVNIAWDDDVITLECSDNTEYLADYVIFTGSLGVLKERHDTLFTPELPERKVSAIEHSGYASLEKIILEFSQPFWDTSDDFAQYSILWRQQDINSLLGTDREWSVLR